MFWWGEAGGGDQKADTFVKHFFFYLLLGRLPDHLWVFSDPFHLCIWCMSEERKGSVPWKMEGRILVHLCLQD